MSIYIYIYIYTYTYSRQQTDATRRFIKARWSWRCGSCVTRRPFDFRPFFLPSIPSNFPVLSSSLSTLLCSALLCPLPQDEEHPSQSTRTPLQETPSSDSTATRDSQETPLHSIPPARGGLAVSQAQLPLHNKAPPFFLLRSTLPTVLQMASQKRIAKVRPPLSD